MTERRRIRLVQAIYGSIILTLMIQPIAIMGYSSYIWLIFMPLLLFFAFGANFKLIPSMIASYACGILWALVNGILSGALTGVLGVAGGNTLATIVMIFLILTIHENLLEGTIIGNVPALFMGLASTFFTFMIIPSNAPGITPVHLFGLFVYGVIMSVILAGGGFKLCSTIFGMDKTVKALTPKTSEH